MPHRFIRPTAVRNFFLILAAVFSFRSSFSQSTDQNYPVSASAFVAAQPNQNLSAYFSSNQALSVTLLLKDLTKPSLQVYLKWSIEGPGVRVASMEGYIPTGLILLDKGVLRRFSGLELQSDYFRNSVIEEQGLGGAGLRTNLPEGFYTFRVQAMEAGTGRQVSNIAETYFSITTPLPPVINLPFNGAEVMMTEPQRVNIQWMPRHYKQAGNTTTYDLKVCKVPDGYEPQEALDACLNPIIDDKANPGTFYPGNTGIGNSIIGAFERGARYAVRVTVHEFDGKSEEVVFANEGRSEVTWFTYGTPRSDGRCVSPPNLTIKELGSGRLQLSWASQGGDARADTKDYKIHYRKAGAANWTTQNIEGITATVSGLSQGTYEFAVQSACTDVFPANIQAFELSDDEDEDDLIPALADPLNTIVTVSGTGIPYVIDSLHSVLDVIKIPCASQISTYESCEADLPVVSPVGTKPLPSLSAGDVLSVYDMTVIVTSVGNGTGGFSGKGLAKLPFMEGTMVSVEFEGVQAWAPKEPGISGGCVYQINGYFRAKTLSAEELARQQSGLVATLNNPKDSTAFTGTLSDALEKYDDGVTTTDLSKYTAAVLQGSQTIANALNEVVDEYSDPRLIYISTKLDSLMQVLKTNDSLMKVTGVIVRIDNLTGIYTDLFKKLEELKNEGKPDVNNPVYAISNVQVSNVDVKSARISWQAEGPVTRYVIEYRDTDGGTLQETVTGTQLNLLRLRTGMEYNYRILAYNDDELVASYGEDRFKTTGKFVPVPVNLAYSRIDDNSVKITWDPDAVHKRFKIRYEDKNGEIRYVYPTTNTAVLDGLDPERFHDYEIVAYNQESLESGPANARVSTKVECNLGVSISNYQNNTWLTGNQHSIMASGCFGVDFKQVDGYPKISWTNGTLGTIGPNGKITFADGEIAEISTDNSPFIGADRLLAVNPTTSKTYTAICKMSASAQPCTYSVNVNVPSPDCKGDFVIAASSLSFDKGNSVTLTAENCKGTVIWNNGLGQGSSVTLQPLSNFVASAQCIDEHIVCYSNGLDIKVLDCLKSLYVSGTKFIESRPFWQWPPWKKVTVTRTTIRPSGCNGKIVDWSHTGDAKGEVHYNKQGYDLIDIKGEVTVKAKCVSGNDCEEMLITVSAPDKKCDGRALSLNRNIFESSPKPVILSSDYAFKLYDESGALLNLTFEKSITFPVEPGDKRYDAEYENGCKSSISIVGYFPSYEIEWQQSNYLNSAFGRFAGDHVDITNKTLEPTIGGHRFALEMYLYPSCKGKTVWTNDKNPDFRLESSLNGLRFENSREPFGGLGIVPFPNVTTKYYGACLLLNSDGTESLYTGTNSKTIIVNSNDCFRVEKNKASVSKGGSIILTAVGCTQTTWKLGEKQIGAGKEITVSPVPETTPATMTYTATCEDLQCIEEVSVQVLPCTFKIRTPKTLVKIAEPAVISATGCSGGTIQWSTGETGETITIKPTEDTKYKAWCMADDITLCDGEVAIKVDKKAPDEIECPEFTLSYTPVEKCSEVTIIPKGCPESGSILWEEATTTKGTESYSVILNTEKKIKATCTTQYGQKVPAETTVSPRDPLLKVSPMEVYSGVNQIIYASGCYNDRCEEGTYKWEREGASPLFGSNVKVKLLKKTDFTVTCLENKKSEIVSIDVKQFDCVYEDYNAMPRGNRNSVELNADWCDTRYPINWFRDTAIWGMKGWERTTSEYSAGQNKKKLGVSRVTNIDETYIVTCVREGTNYPCNFPFSVYSKETYDFFDTKEEFSGTGQTGPTTSPEVCNELSFLEKSGNAPGRTGYLYSDFCPGHVQWFVGDAGSQGKMVTDLSNGRRYRTRIVNAPQTYYYVCYYSGGKCEGFSTIDPEPNESSNGRIAAVAATTSTVTDEECTKNTPVSTAMKAYYKTLLCQADNLYKGNRAAATKFLNEMIASLKANSPGVNIKFPTNLTPIIDAMVAGDCGKAAELLAAANGNATIDNDVFNKEVIDKYKEVIDDVVPEEGAQCNAAPAPVVERDIKETVNGRIAAYDYTGLFIAPDGRAVRLPAGAKPVVIRFTKEYVAPPQGTLQGFELANGNVYFAEIRSYGNTFDGYRLIKTPMCPEVRLTDIYAGASDKAYYMEKFSENGKCGYRLIEGAYKFTPTGSTSLVDIRVPVTGEEIVNWEYETCTEGPEYLTAAGRSKLTQKLKDFGDKNTGITISECSKPEKHTVSVEGVDKIITSKPIQINMCWDGKKWVITHSFKPGALKIPAGYNGTVAEVEAVSNLHANRVKETGIKPYDDGENYYQGIDFIQALVEVKEATLKLCNEAKVPEKYWDPALKSPVKAPTLSGVGDGAIEEIKSIPELVGFGLQLATEPEVAHGIWNSIKNLTPTKVKTMLLGAAEQKLAKYTQGGDIMKHEAGKDGVQVAMLFISGGIKGTTKIKEATDLMDDVAAGVASKLDDLGESIIKNSTSDAKEVVLKAVKNNDLTRDALEEAAEELKDAGVKADKNWWENLIKGKNYGKNITDKYIKTLDDGYYSKAASEFGISKEELKAMAHVDELQINIGNGNFAVADNVWSKRVGQSNTFEVYINETKLSAGTNPTKRQGELFSAAEAGSVNITVRNLDKGGFKQGDKFIVKGIIKTNGNGSVSDFYNIKKI
jgi:hypothetical protein